ncbi:HupE/UreJ family protein [Thiohalophilus sp.]|uniref:HupE/UreJ family protein n=1 Tax=Thiohalophilus sp. TaxID=3028392 RepID=UPI003974D566
MKIANNIQKNPLHGAFAFIGGLLMIISSPAFAHHPMGGMTPETFSQGMLSGLGHPIIGLDHFAFLIVAILLACALKGAARYLVPVVFIGATVGGTMLHVGAANIPMAEMLVALTVVVGGVLLVTRHYLGALVLGAVFAVSGVLHGYAYGEAIIGAETTPLLAYLAGFAIIQYALIAGGVFGLEKLAAHSEKARAVAARIGSMAALLTGGLFFVQSLA